MALYSEEKLQLEKEITQLVQNNPTPKFKRGTKIDSDLRSELQSWAAQRKRLIEKMERLEIILEEERIQAILRELEEMHPQVGVIFMFMAYYVFTLIVIHIYGILCVM